MATESDMQEYVPDFISKTFPNSYREQLLPYKDTAILLAPPFFLTVLYNCCLPLIFPFHHRCLIIVFMCDIFIDLTFLTTARTKVICLNCRRYHELIAQFYIVSLLKGKTSHLFYE